MTKPQAYRDDEDVCTGCGKVSYPRRKSAVRRMKLLQRRSGKGRKHASRGPMEAYRCPFGNGWHVGHNRPPAPSIDPVVRIAEREGDEDAAS